MESKRKRAWMTPSEISLFCQQVELLLQSGIPLHEGMRSLAENYQTTAYREALQELAEKVDQTGSLYEGMRESPLFPAYAREMVRLGGIKPEEAKHHPDKNIITRAIGAKADVDVDFYEHRLKRGDIILMCTDGLSNMVEDEELFHIVQGGRDIVEAGQALVDAAKENGGTDNIGIVLIEPFADEVSVL